MRTRKRILASLTVFVVFVVLIAGAVGTGWLVLRGVLGQGSSALEQWCGKQIERIAADLLRPTLRIEGFDYVYPKTLILEGVTLVDGDVTCLETPRMQLVFRDIPRLGKPIVIDTVALDAPVLRLVVRGDGTIAGFSNMVKSTDGKTYEDGGSTRPSDVLAVRDLKVTSGSFEWTPDSGQTMKLDDLTFAMTGKPDTEPGWYAIDADLDRAPVLDLRTTGRFDLNEAVLDLEQFTLDVTLDGKNRDTLPPTMQSMLDRYDVRGRLEITGRANLPFMNQSAATLDADVKLTQAFVAGQRIQIPVDQLAMHVAVANQLVQIANIDATIFDGQLTGNGSIELKGDHLATAKLDGKGLRIERALRETSTFETGVAGALAFDGSISAPLSTLPAGLDGGGTVTIEEGRLMNDPVLGGMMRELGDHPENLHDRATADVQLHPAHIRVERVRVVAGLVGARGEGEIEYDGGIDVRFNAGPIERVENATGPIGELAGLLTDRVVTYEVEGTWQHPDFSVHPLGIGAGPKPETKPEAQPERESNADGMGPPR